MCPPRYELGHLRVAHDEDHREEGSEGDQSETVDELAPPGHRRASPSPSAVTRGTVTVEVVTPPESYASGTIALGANASARSTIAYPTIMKMNSGTPTTMRRAPTATLADDADGDGNSQRPDLMRRPRLSSALSATAISDGSAIVAAKPRLAAKRYTQ